MSGNAKKSVLLSASIALLSQWAASHFAQAQVIADGTVETASGTIDTGSSPVPSGYALHALNGGVIGSASPLTLVTGAANANAARAEQGGSITLFNGSSATTNGSDATVLFATGTGSSIAATNTTVRANNFGTFGAFATDGGTIILNGGSVSSLNSALRVDPGGTIFAFNVSAIANGGNAIGVFANSGTINLRGGSVTAVQGSSDHGLQATSANAIINADGVTVTATGNGIHAATGGIVRFDNGTIVSSQAGIRVNSAGYAAMANSSITTSADGAHGLFSTDAGSTLDASGVSVTTTGTAAFGVAAEAGALLRVNGGSVATQGTNAFGLAAWDTGRLLATGASVTTQASGAGGLLVVDGAMAELHEVTLRTLGAASNPLYSFAFGANQPVDMLVDGGTVTAARSATIRIAGANASIAVRNGAELGSDIGRLMDVVPLGNAPGQVTLTANGARLSGDIFVDAVSGSKADIILQNNSILTGAVVGASRMVVDPSQWNVSGNSTISGGLVNAGVILFTPPATASTSGSGQVAPGDSGIATTLAGVPTGSGDTALAPMFVSAGFKTLTVGSYVGNGGTLGLNTRLAGDGSPSDRLVINGGAASGQSSLRITNAGGAGALTTANGIEIVSTTNGGTTAADAFILNGRAVAGPYEYRLQRGARDGSTPDAWYLLSAQAPVPPTPPGPPAPPLPPAPLYRPEVAAYLANQRLSGQMFVHSLHDRLGEPQYIEGQDFNRDENMPRSAWLRVVGKWEGSESKDGNFKTSTDSFLLHGGTEIARWETRDENDANRDPARAHLGLMASYGSASTDAEARGNPARAWGKVEGWALGIYGTWYQNDKRKLGAYVDTWLQYGWFSNRVESDQLPTVRYHAEGLALSGEVGYAFPLHNDWIFEPQAQLIYLDYRENDITEPNGTRVTGSSSDGLVTRLGVRTYRTFVRNDGRKLQPYVTLNWWYSDTGSSISFNQLPISTLYPHNRFEIKLGMNADLGKRWTGWANVSGALGQQNFYQYALRVGVKYTW
ncbi:autotransporter family protein [Cupriavidus metallidurans]|jgi:autotransporter family porin|uniref:autotransporter family protein n=1 Tax=Cupriavidus metallidurans TaxID=119219 RepID=UPI0007639BCF|nr:autotransporter outer membrane beta-barrel domain-containing protein [Cupriavidus metallidurans]KWW34052.1 Outer membrane protein IcsA autotransporter [Cupriavidus metallidurans]